VARPLNPPYGSGGQIFPGSCDMRFLLLREYFVALAHLGCDGEINAMVEGSKFRESHVLEILS
jgi:hypothetical protein